MTTLYDYHDTQTDYRDRFTLDQVRADLSGLLRNLNPVSPDAQATWLALGRALDAINAGDIDRAAGHLSTVGITLTVAQVQHA